MRHKDDGLEELGWLVIVALGFLFFVLVCFLH